MATGGTGAGLEPLGASAARAHEPWAGARALGLGCAARCARGGRGLLGAESWCRQAAPSRAPRPRRLCPPLAMYFHKKGIEITYTK